MLNYEDMGYDKVFVCLDGTESQDKVLERAIVVAANNNAELYIAHVIDSTAFETAGTYPSDLIPALEASFRDSIAEGLAAAEAQERISKVEVVIKTGRIRETLKDDLLDVIKPDCVVCGAPQGERGARPYYSYPGLHACKKGGVGASTLKFVSSLGKHTPIPARKEVRDTDEHLEKGFWSNHCFAAGHRMCWYRAACLRTSHE